MNYLVDTHILLWSFMEPAKLTNTVKSILTDENNSIFYSPVSLWEISIKYGKGKLFLNGGAPDDFFAELADSFFQCKSILPENFITNYKLPVYHKDPFVRFLIWDTINSDFILLSCDEKMEKYINDGLKVIF